MRVALTVEVKDKLVYGSAALLERISSASSTKDRLLSATAAFEKGEEMYMAFSFAPAAASLAEAARAEAVRASSALGLDEAHDISVLGPAPAPLARLRGRYRFQVLVKGRRPELQARVTRHLAECCTRLPGAVRATVDVNPGSML